MYLFANLVTFSIRRHLGKLWLCFGKLTTASRVLWLLPRLWFFWPATAGIRCGSSPPEVGGLPKRTPRAFAAAMPCSWRFSFWYACSRQQRTRFTEQDPAIKVPIQFLPLRYPAAMYQSRRCPPLYLWSRYATGFEFPYSFGPGDRCSKCREDRPCAVSWPASCIACGRNPSLIFCLCFCSGSPCVGFMRKYRRLD